MSSAVGNGPGAPATKETQPTLSAKEAQYDIVKATQVSWRGIRLRLSTYGGTVVC